MTDQFEGDYIEPRISCLGTWKAVSHAEELSAALISGPSDASSYSPYQSLPLTAASLLLSRTIVSDLLAHASVPS